jgi:hypothetical protein
MQSESEQETGQDHQILPKMFLSEQEVRNAYQEIVHRGCYRGTHQKLLDDIISKFIQILICLLISHLLKIRYEYKCLSLGSIHLPILS